MRGGGGSASIVVTISRDVWLVEALVQGYNSPASVKEAVLWKSFDRNALGLGARTDGHQSVCAFLVIRRRLKEYTSQLQC